MYKVVTDSRLTENFQEKFVDQLSKQLPEDYTNDVGFQGGNRSETIWYNPSIDLWFTSSQDVEGCERFWNAFGIQDPSKVKSLDIAVEINIPFNHNPRVGGVFVQDVSGRVFVAHRGVISGGRKGIGKGLFMQHYDARKLEPVDDDGKVAMVALIGEIESPNLAKDIKQFAEEIIRIKNIGVSLNL